MTATKLCQMGFGLLYTCSMRIHYVLGVLGKCLLGNWYLIESLPVPRPIQLLSDMCPIFEHVILKQHRHACCPFS